MSDEYWNYRKKPMSNALTKVVNIIPSQTSIGGDDYISCFKRERNNSIRTFKSQTNIKKNKVSKKPKSLPMVKTHKYLRDQLLGLDYLHNYANIIHRDIKPENLQIDEFDNLKISDFGTSEVFLDEANGADCFKTSKIKGTQSYIAPEVFSHEYFLGKPLDIWGVGCTVYQFITGDTPFKLSDDIVQVKKSILEDE